MASKCGLRTLGAAIAAVFLALGTLGSAQEVGQTVQADDLPPAFQLLFGVEEERECRWTLIARNDKAQEQEALHPELNAIDTIWHLPLTKNRSAFKFEFTRPIRTGNNVFHLYVKADGDDNTGRKDGVAHKGVDYMFTLIDGDPDHASTRLDVFEPDGRGRRGACTVMIRENVVYIAVEIDLLQQDGQSVFEYYVSSYVKDGGPNTTLPYRQVISEGAPDTIDSRLLINPELVVINGGIPGWRLAGRGAQDAIAVADSDDNCVLIDHLYAGGAFSQTVSLAPGHYLLRALIKTDSFAMHLCALGYRIPVGVRDRYQWVELPFCVTGPDPDAFRAVEVGVWNIGYPPTRHRADIRIRKMELLRLGDTVLPERWVENLPADPLHGLRLLNDSSAWDRPGKVVFEDTFIGTELWLMTQEGQLDHSYVGHPDFSHEGKYLHFGTRRIPRGLLRTDGSQRYLNDDWGGIVWPFPWQQNRLPKGASPTDWIVASRSTAEVQLHNVITRENWRIELPSRPGWRIVHYPGIGSYGGRGPSIHSITHEMLVWVAEDNRSLGLSTIEGDRFRTFPVRSISAKPQEDTLSPSMSSVWGKGGDNWRDAVDHDGTRYFLFEINRDNLPDHPTNPYQAWALPLTERDNRGLLQVVFNPKVTVTEYVSTHTGKTPQPSFNWWELAAGLPRSGDNAVLLLEDGTLVHMSSLGMHSSFRDTIQTNCPISGDVAFLGSFPRLDRITWPHEFRRDRDFAVVASHAEPASPIVMLDFEHSTIWNLVLTHFHDYAIRYKTRWDNTAYHKPMFRPAPTFSADFTKAIYFSAMLTGDHPDRKWGDMYVAVARYPQPPVNVRVKRGLLPWKRHSLTWERPQYHAEIEGFNVYRADESGRGYEKVNRELLAQTDYELPPDAGGFYVLTSVEYSGLESRMFSNEVPVGNDSVFRHFYQAETGRLTAPMVPFFEPADASCAYAVAITDPELLYREKLLGGLTGTVTVDVAVPRRGPLRVVARVRGMSPMERSTYTTGRPFRTDSAAGTFTVKLAGRRVADIPVSGPDWRWVSTGLIPARRSWGTVELEFATSDAGIAIDNILVTNDPDFVPAGRGQEPQIPPTIPEDLRRERFSTQDLTAAGELMKKRTPRIKLAWSPATAPQGLSHYNVYRSDSAAFEAQAETLLGSPRDPVFYDCGLDVGQTVYYRVCAVDAWGNRSPASAPLAVTAQAPPLEAGFRMLGEQNVTSGQALTFDAGASRTDAGQIEHWHWTFGDGASAQGQTVTHTFAAPGTYAVNLIVGNDRGEWAMAEQSVHVRPDWIQRVLEQGAVWIEAEDKTDEGDGTSQRILGRVNASGAILSHWDREPGHWLEWTVQVPKAAPYAIALKYASGAPQALRDCRIDGEFPGEAWKQQVFPGTGGYSANADNWTWRTLQDADGRALRVELTKGTHTLRMSNLGGGMALDVLMLVPFDAVPAALGGRSSR